jgi:hypothetical protein
MAEMFVQISHRLLNKPVKIILHSQLLFFIETFAAVTKDLEVWVGSPNSRLDFLQIFRHQKVSLGHMMASKAVMFRGLIALMQQFEVQIHKGGMWNPTM